MHCDWVDPHQSIGWSYSYRSCGEQPSSVSMVFICILSQSFEDWIVYQLLLTGSFEDNNILYM